MLDIEENISSTYRFDAFGQFLHEGKVKSPWTFSGQRYDDATKLFHFANRDYDSLTGRWLTPDPLGFADGPNLYAYVHNKPLIFVDPYGLMASEIGQNNNESGNNWASRVSLNTRIHGAFRAAAGFTEMCIGGAVVGGSSGLATPLGASMAIHGADHLVTGLTTVFTGRYNNTATSQMLHKTGMSQNTANMIDNSLSIGATMGGIASLRSAQAQALNLSATTASTSASTEGMVLSRGAESSKSGANLQSHLRYCQRYGNETGSNIKFLQNGRIRYYDVIEDAKKIGEMKGRRYVHEFNPANGRSRGWNETLDQNLNIRQVRPQLDSKVKKHYFFDKQGNFEKTW